MENTPPQARYGPYRQYRRLFAITEAAAERIPAHLSHPIEKHELLVREVDSSAVDRDDSLP
jgi:hypothetical protein